MRVASVALLVLAVAGALHGTHAVSIMEFGALPGDPSDSASLVNAKALQLTLAAANASSTDRTALVPSGLNFTFFPLVVSGLQVRMV
jgi:hypothetical protein